MRGAYGPMFAGVLAAFAVAFATDARAEILVSNGGSAIDENVVGVHLHSKDVAQEFTTGRSQGGWLLTRAYVRFGDVGVSDRTYSMSIRTYTPEGTPGTAVGEMQTRGEVRTNTMNTFWTVGGDIHLEGDTRYVLIVEGRSGQGNRVRTTGSNEEYAGHSGWSIANTGLRRARGGGSWTRENEVLMMILDGWKRQVAINSIPRGGNARVTARENTPYAFRVQDFPFSDQDEGDTLGRVEIVSLPTRGELRGPGGTLSAGETVDTDESGSLQLTYYPPEGAYGNGYASFSFRVNDGKATSTSSYRMTVNIARVDHPPSGRPAISGTANVGRTLSADTRGIIDRDGLMRQRFAYQWLRVETIGGQTTETQIQGAMGRAYTLTSDDAGKRVKVRVAVTDDRSNPAVNIDSAAYPEDGVGSNSPPTVSEEAEVDVTQDRTYQFEIGDFEFADEDGSDVLEAVRVTSLPGAGTLRIGGRGVVLGTRDTASRSDILHGRFTYTPPAGQSGDDFATFDFRVSDGVDESASSYGMVIEVEAVEEQTAPRARISTDRRYIAEGTSERATLTVTLDRSSSQTQKVSYGWAIGASETATRGHQVATPGSDFTALEGTLTFSPGQTRKTLRLESIDDDIAEMTQEVRIKIEADPESTVTIEEQGGEATVSITDDDPLDLTWEQSRYIVNENAGTVDVVMTWVQEYEYNRFMTRANYRPTRSYGIDDEGDISGTGETVTWTGQREHALTISITNDNVAERDGEHANESFTIEVVALPGGDGAPSGRWESTTVTIQDNDELDDDEQEHLNPPLISIEGGGVEVTEPEPHVRYNNEGGEEQNPDADSHYVARDREVLAPDLPSKTVITVRMSKASEERQRVHYRHKRKESEFPTRGASHAAIPGID